MSRDGGIALPCDVLQGCAQVDNLGTRLGKWRLTLRTLAARIRYR